MLYVLDAIVYFGETSGDVDHLSFSSHSDQIENLYPNDKMIENSPFRNWNTFWCSGCLLSAICFGQNRIRFRALDH